MKKAFTLIELVFVVMIIGILSSLAISSFNRPTLIEAANQVVSHIRYTQHLAMMDNKFDATKPNTWFQGRWQIRFFENLSFSSLAPNKNYSKIWSYTIFSDKPNYTHNPDISEMARNPLNRSQFLSGGFNNVLHIEDERSMKEMRLGQKYGIKDIRFSNGCRGGIEHLQFDHLGRPFNNYITSGISYGVMHSTYPRLIRKSCKIDLCIIDDCDIANTEELITIAIEPETGYVHIL